MAETMIERMPLIKDMGVTNGGVEAGLEIRQTEKVIIGITSTVNEEKEGGHSVHFDLDKDVDSAKENKDPKYISIEESYNLSNKITENGSKSHDIIEKKIESEIKEAEQQVVDYDVERVIAEQETHDLFCPNCRSCITNRVILRKRKRIPGQNSADFAPLEKEYQDKIEAENVHQDEEVFRRLSRFSFFIPTEGRFNIFRAFRKSEEKSSLSSSNTIPGKKANYISFLFGSNSSNNQNRKADNDNIPTGPTANKPILEDDNSPKLPVATHLPSDVPIKRPLLPKIPVEGKPSIQPPETPAVVGTVTDIGVVQEVAAPRRREWDIMKSIVYGGLTESITSLSVVSSAAGAGSSTLNICALGLAKLVSGLFLVSHELSELKRGTPITETTDQTQSQYYKKLGKRENFKRHAFFTILSFIVFGLVPPIVYGFAFRESDNKEYKIIAVAASTFPCIAILALGKAHVNPQKGYFRSLIYYIGLALPASGLGYVAGVMINRLFEEFGLFDQGTYNNPTISLVTSVPVDM